MNPLVSKVHGKEKRWSAEFAALRRLCLASGLNEELKWGQACYDLNGSNVVLIHGFKNYARLALRSTRRSMPLTIARIALTLKNRSGFGGI